MLVIDFSIKKNMDGEHCSGVNSSIDWLSIISAKLRTLPDGLVQITVSAQQGNAGELLTGVQSEGSTPSK